MDVISTRDNSLCLNAKSNIIETQDFLSNEKLMGLNF